MDNSHIVARSLAMISQFAIYMLVPIFLCSFCGYALDSRLGTNLFFVAFFFLGALAGGRNIWLLSRKIYDGGDTRPSERYAANQKGKGKK